MSKPIIKSHAQSFKISENRAQEIWDDAERNIPMLLEESDVGFKFVPLIGLFVSNLVKQIDDAMPEYWINLYHNEDVEINEEDLKAKVNSMYQKCTKYPQKNERAFYAFLIHAISMSIKDKGERKMRESGCPLLTWEYGSDGTYHHTSQCRMGGQFFKEKCAVPENKVSKECSARVLQRLEQESPNHL